MRTYEKVSKFAAVLSVFAMIFVLAGNAFAAVTPTFSAAGTGDGDTVQITATGDANASVLLDYNKTNIGPTIQYIGTTNTSGMLSVTESTASLAVASGSTAYVTIDSAASPVITWPIGTSTGNFSFSQTSVVLGVGSSATINALNSSGSIYLSNNSNPSAANISISGSQITIYGNTAGSTTSTLCEVGNSSTCASLYITVGSSSTSALTFSINTVTVAPGQSVPITITGGNTGLYTVLNNSNSSVIQTNISSNIITLSTSTTSGTAAITVCSSDMAACGVINATAGSASTLPVVFSQTNPTLSLGQSLNVSISGGSATIYYLSANTSPSIINAVVSGSTLELIGDSTGSSNITVCSSGGSCATLIATVGYTSTGGTLTLSQSAVSLLVGQVLSITASGGTSPYNIVNNSSTLFQASLNGNVVTLSGLALGSGYMYVCSSGGSCVELNVVVNSSGSGTAITFTPSSAATVAVGASTTLTIAGSGGYYVSTSTNAALASITINGSIATVTGLQAGSENVSVCESSGQCAILFVSVGTTTSTTAPTLSQTSATLAVGQSQAITVTGATGSYYVSANSNPTDVAVTLVGSTLTAFGLANGSSTVTVCASGGSCTNITVTVGTGTSSAVSFAIPTLPVSVLNQSYSEQLAATGGSGSYTYAVTSGVLPSGLELSSTGFISGIPTSTGSYPFSVTATDTTGNSATAAMTLEADNTTTTTATASSAFPVSGTLIDDSGTYYLIENGVKEGVTNPGILQTYGYTFAEASLPTASQSALATSGNLSPASGSLVKTADDPTVYLVANGNRYGFTSESAFSTLGYSFGSVRTVTDPELDVLPVSTPLQATITAHVKGTNVMTSDGTIYYTDGVILYPYTSLSSYNSWNLPNDFTTVVQANSADLALPIGSAMGTRS
jgi:hypothetical protein